MTFLFICIVLFATNAFYLNLYSNMSSGILVKTFTTFLTLPFNSISVKVVLLLVLQHFSTPTLHISRNVGLRKWITAAI